MERTDRNGYAFTNAWFEFAEYEAKVKPVHTALFLFYVHCNNRLGWDKIEFGAPTEHTMEVLGIGNRKTFKNAFSDLLNWGFIKLRQNSLNQHSARRIELCLFNSEQAEMNRQNSNLSTGNAPIIKQLNNKTLKKGEEESLFIEKKDFEDFDEALLLYWESDHFKYFKNTYKLSNKETFERFKAFWEQKEAFGELHYTTKECFEHFHKWHPKNLKAGEENAPRIKPWQADFIKVK